MFTWTVSLGPHERTERPRVTCRGPRVACQGPPVTCRGPRASPAFPGGGRQPVTCWRWAGGRGDRPLGRTGSGAHRHLLPLVEPATGGGGAASGERQRGGGVVSRRWRVLRAEPRGDHVTCCCEREREPVACGVSTSWSQREGGCWGGGGKGPPCTVRALLGEGGRPGCGPSLEASEPRGHCCRPPGTRQPRRQGRGRGHREGVGVIG